MVACDELYRVWERRGNFCKKSENTAKQIEEYIEYRKRYKLESYEINRCALSPFMMIEGKNVLHLRCLNELRKVARKKGGRRITRRISIEIINKVNDEIEQSHKITHIPQIRTRMGDLQHEVSSISYQVRDSFDKLKTEIGIKSNNYLLLAMINYCSLHKDDVLKLRETMALENDEREEIEFVKNP